MDKTQNSVIKQTKILMLSIFVIITLVIAVFLYLGSLQQQAFRDTVIEEERNTAKRIYLQTFDIFIDKYESIANNILQNNEVINAFERGDRKKLLELTLPTYQQLQKDNPYLQIFHFHTPKTHSFLRVHKPNKFGDYLGDIRHMINRVNKDHIKQIGLEIGRYGIHYRVALPVFNEKNQFLGTFELGINFEYIIDIFKNTYGYDSILLFKKELFDIMFGHYKENFTYLDYSKDFYEVKHQWSYDQTQNDDCTTFKVNAISDSSQNVVGRILFKKDFSYYTKDIESIYKNLIGVVVFLILVLLYVIEKLFSNYYKTVDNHHDELLSLSNTDFLTKIHNRKSIHNLLEDEIDRSKRYNHPLSIILFDVDDFKMINDNFGHNIGDEVLVSISEIVSHHIRKTDFFGRWGGEEFLLILTETPMDVGSELAEKIREKIASHDFNDLKVTCSFGISEYYSEDTIEALIHNADTALYESKHNGKNNVTVFSE